MIVLKGGNLLTKGGKYRYPITETARNIIGIIQDDASLNLSDAEVMYNSFLVGNIIENGLWDIPKAMWGFVGRTSATHKWNWKDMRNLDDAYRIIWNGTITHNNLGIKGDGSTGYGLTRLFTNQFTTSRGVHMSFYRTQAGVSGGQRQEVGTTGSMNEMNLRIDYVTSNPSRFVTGVFNVGSSQGYTVPQSNGLYLSSYKDSSIIMIKDIITTTPASGNTIPNREFAILAAYSDGVPSFFSNRGAGFISVGDGFTNQQAILFSNIVTTAQKILGRA